MCAFSGQFATREILQQKDQLYKNNGQRVEKAWNFEPKMSKCGAPQRPSSRPRRIIDLKKMNLTTPN